MVAKIYTTLSREWNKVRRGEEEIMPEDVAKMYPLTVTRSEDGSVGMYFQNLMGMMEAEYKDAISRGDMKSAQRVVDKVAGSIGYDTSGSVVNGVFLGNASHSYRGMARKSTPVSEWGHMMFVDNPDKAYWSGNVSDMQDELYSVPVSELTDIIDLRDEIIKKLKEDRENGVLDDIYNMDYLDGVSEEGIADTFNPRDIVDSAEAWDNGELLKWFWDRVGEPNGLKGVKTADGAIAFSGNGIVQRVANNDVVIYDEAGNVVPLSQRFNGHVGDMYFQNASTNHELISGKPWPKNFPDVVSHISYGELQSRKSELYKKAKNGDIEAAKWLVRKTINVDKIKQLGKKYPDAVVVAVQGKATGSENVLSRVYASAVAQIAGFRLNNTIVQANRASRTGKRAAYRFTHRINFTGDVIAGQHYIIVDDNVTQGGTLSDLRRYIESKGGNVVAASTLTYGQNGTKLTISQDTIKAIKGRSDYEEIKQYIKSNGISDSIESLTEREGRYVLSASQNTFRNRSNTQTDARNRQTARRSISGSEIKPNQDNVQSAGTEESDRHLSSGDIYYQPAWHGSPRRFLKFMLEHIGTGEGAQAFGWGLYFSSKREVAESYYRRFSNSTSGIFFDDKPFAEIENRTGYEVLRALSRMDEAHFDANERSDLATDIKLLTAKYEKRLGTIKEQPYSKSKTDRSPILDTQMDEKNQELQNELDWLKTNKDKISLHEGDGQLYKVDLPDDTGNYLLWDKGFSEQSKSAQGVVRKLIEGLSDEALEDFDDVQRLGRDKAIKNVLKQFADTDGKRIYGTLATVLGSDRAASLALNEAGIVGIKYLDGTSRSKGEGSYNYVIFDENAIQMLDTYYQGNQGLDKETIEAIKAATPKERVTRNSDVRAALAPFKGKDITNMATGEVAQIASTQINNMISRVAVDKSLANGFTAEDHLTAAANIVSLYEHAFLTDEREDRLGDVNIKSIKHFGALFLTYHGPAEAVLTIKETMQHGNRIYSLKLEEIRKPTVLGEEAGNTDTAHTAGNQRVAEIAEKINRYNQQGPRGSISFNRDTGKALVTLFRRADRSTFIHEMGHLMLDDLIRLSKDMDPESGMARDLLTTLDYLGISDMDLSDVDSLDEVNRARLHEDEAARGQVAVTRADLLKIPEIIANPDYIVFGTKNRIGREGIIYVKNMPNGSTYYIEEIRRKSS